jgi:predicted NBD/HSP70 family sugar kinase
MVADVFLGLDVGGTNIRAVLGSEGGQVVSGPVLRPVAADYPSFLAIIAELTDDLKVERGDVSAIGVGVPGSTDERGPRWVPALPFLDGLPSATISVDGSGRRSDLPTTRTARFWPRAIEEPHVGCATSCWSRSAPASEARCSPMDAWSMVPPESPVPSVGFPASVPPDPRHGPWERAASGAALGRLAAEVCLSAGQLIDAARRGDAHAQGLLDRFAYALGSGIASLASCLDPEAVVMGGRLSEAFDVLEPLMLRAVSDWASPAGRAVRIVPAQLGADAGVVGALLLAGQPMKESG